MTPNRRVTWQVTSNDENSWPRSAARRVAWPLAVRAQQPAMHVVEFLDGQSLSGAVRALKLVIASVGRMPRDYFFARERTLPETELTTEPTDIRGRSISHTYYDRRSHPADRPCSDAIKSGHLPKTNPSESRALGPPPELSRRPASQRRRIAAPFRSY